MKQDQGMDRRHFIKGSAAGLVGAGVAANANLLTAQENSGSETPRIREYRPLGRTGFKASDISSGYCADEGVLKAALDAGVNYIDTAESYKNEEVVGKVVKERNRKDYFITTKLAIDKDVSKEKFLERTAKCLERLQTDYVDCMMIHSCAKVDHLKLEGFHDAMKEMKAAGKVRFVGVSNHGKNYDDKYEDTMKDVLVGAADDGRFDVILMTYNFLQDNGADEVIEVCQEKNIGVTLMKVNPVGSYYQVKEYIEKQEKENKEVPAPTLDFYKKLQAMFAKSDPFMEKYGLTEPKAIRDASIKFCLNNRGITTVCCGLRSFEHLDIFLPLSGTKLAPPEQQKLSLYKEHGGFLYCRHACGICEGSCPQRVPVNTIMRYNYYFDIHGREKDAMVKYHSLPTAKADSCRDCAGHCQDICPYGVPVQGLLDLAHQRLRLG